MHTFLFQADFHSMRECHFQVYFGSCDLLNLNLNAMGNNLAMSSKFYTNSVIVDLIIGK